VRSKQNNKQFITGFLLTLPNISHPFQTSYPKISLKKED